MLVPRHQVCDGIINCADLSDECLCEKQVSNICNHVKLRTERLPTLCLPGQVYCGNGNLSKCVNRTSVCDGISDCINNLDEKFSYCHGTLSCSKGLLTDAGMPCRCDTSQCFYLTSVRGVRSGILCNGIEDCGLNGPGVKSRAVWAVPPGFPPDECNATCPDVPGKFNCTVSSVGVLGAAVGPPSMVACTKNVTFPNGTKIVKRIGVSSENFCDGVLECTGDYIDEKNCPNRFSCRIGNLVSIPKSQVCDGYENCDNGMDESKILCQENFYCKSLKGQKVSVSTKVVCDFNINCDKAEDEMNCSSVDGRFYCENKKPLFVRKKQVLDGRGDCTDWSDECSEKFKTGANVLSSRYELIANPFLRAIVWIMALLAFFGNLIVIVGEIKSLQKVFSKAQGASPRTNHMLVLNLAVADFLMAIYLLMLGIAGAVYSGSYCSQSLSWLTSQSCVAMGVLVVLSSETSVLTMLLLTGSRLFAVYNPIASLSKPSFRAVLLMIMLTWTISLTLALVPLSASQQSSFVERALIGSNPFFSNVVVHFDAAKNFTIKLLTYSKHLSSQPDSVLLQVQAMTSWNELEQFLANTSQSNLLTISNYFGYYSANSVCIPNLFVTSKDWSWQFSLAISILNFIVFVFVASTYTAIILKARKSINKFQSVGKKSSALQHKILRLIITDFCCWIPLSIMVFINFSGVKIDSISYAVAAIVLLPINSALNPILYSNFIDKIYTKCRGQVPVGSQPTSRIGSTSLSSQNTTKLRLTTRRAESQVVDKASSSAAE
uniref:Uncharacterized protein LOC108950436 n=1 Tax=Phallusia mammillata TaxID=59560 RepID=A0A6F9DIK7_9ASCI|nr:uncharacterized protein LOC108950436 [Phallusia mammillata]